MDCTEVFRDFLQKETVIRNWINEKKLHIDIPVYTSVDIRESGFKAAVVDTNLFPAGFNNLCTHSLQSAASRLRLELSDRFNGLDSVALYIESHTRNLFYLENVFALKSLLESLNLTVYVVTEFSDELSHLDTLTVTSANGNTFEVLRFEYFKALDVIQSNPNGVVILNNDLIQGIPPSLKTFHWPVIPSVNAGWHSRLKSFHFDYVYQLLSELKTLAGFDPWFFTCIDRSVEEIDIFSESDRLKLKLLADEVIEDIQVKYKQYGINEKPYLYVKSDNGTYGMGVISIESSGELLELNRKQKNKLHKGKNSNLIQRFLIQEGIPSRCRFDNRVCEVCLYQVYGETVGGFYRYHDEKNDRESLNSKGMSFQCICTDQLRHPDCGAKIDPCLLKTFKILAQISTLAASLEIQDLERKVIS